MEALSSANNLNLDTAQYLQPFLDIIKSEETNGPITAAVLNSVHKFIQYGFLGERALNRARAIRGIVLNVSRCRFEATDHDVDDVVLVRILRVLEASLHCEAGHLLTNSRVFEMIQTCFKMSVQTRLPCTFLPPSFLSRSRKHRRLAQNSRNDIDRDGPNALWSLST